METLLTHLRPLASAGAKGRKAMKSKSLPFRKEDIIGAAIVWSPGKIGEYEASLELDVTIQENFKTRRYLCELSIHKVAKDVLELFKPYRWDKGTDELWMLPITGIWTEPIMQKVLSAVKSCREVE